MAGALAAGVLEPAAAACFLDWLALEFAEQDYSLKTLLRTITASATYRQSARASAASLERDPANRLLSRSPRTRLSAEQIRDSALVASGLFQPYMLACQLPQTHWQSVPIRVSIVENK